MSPGKPTGLPLGESSEPGTFLIWGAGWHGRLVTDLVRACGHAVAGFIDSDPAKIGRQAEPGGARVVLRQEDFVGRSRASGAYPEGIYAVALGIGGNTARQSALTALAGRRVPSLAHPTAVVSPSAALGRGTLVFPSAVICAEARIGVAVVVESAAIVGHGCVLEDAVYVSPHATLSRSVRVGERSWIGAGAVLLEGVAIGADAVVQAGVVVDLDVPDGFTAGGLSWARSTGLVSRRLDHQIGRPAERPSSA